MFKVRKGGCEEIPNVKGKEQWLCFAGAAMKRYPTSKVRETQVRWQALREGIRGQTDWNHNHRKLANLITRTTVLSNSLKLSHAVWGHPRRMGHGGEVWQMWSTGEGNGKPLQYPCLENPMNSMRSEMIGHWKRNSPDHWVSNMLLENSGEITLERMKGLRQSKNSTQLWMWLVIEARSDAVKSNIA